MAFCFQNCTLFLSGPQLAVTRDSEHLYFDKQGHKLPTICRVMRKEGLVTSCVGIYKFYGVSLDVALLWSGHFEALHTASGFVRQTKVSL